MGGTYSLVVGDRSRIVVPAEVRERAGLTTGNPRVLLKTETALVLLARQQLRARVRDHLSGVDLVGELLASRRESAEMEDEG